MELLTHLLDDDTSSGLHLALDSLREDHPRSILTEEEKEEYRSFSSEQRRHEYLSTRQLIRKLSVHAGLKTEILETRKDKLGKPYCIYGDGRLFMSIAHTEQKVLLALSEQMDVGIDIEPEGRAVGDRLRRRILHPSEEEQLKHVDSVRLWTLKEAAVKLLGCGLRINLNKLLIRPQDEISFLARFNNEKSIRICSFQYRGYWISVANYTKK